MRNYIKVLDVLKRINEFLSKIPIPKIKEGHRQSLNQPVSIQEVDWAIAKLRLGKAPGMNGLTVKFCKYIKEQLLPYLKELFEYCIMVSKIPATWKEARHTLIPKDGRNKVDLGSYCPIALLNVDYTFLNSILAECLKRIIREYVEDHQTRFIRG